MSVTQQYITLRPGEEDRLPFLFLPGAEIRRAKLRAENGFGFVFGFLFGLDSDSGRDPPQVAAGRRKLFPFLDKSCILC
jgi:hypothetical protein